MLLKLFLCRISVLFLLSLLALTGFTFSQSPPQTKKLPPANEPRLRAIDVKHLALDLRFDWQKKQAYGTASLIFAPIKPTDKIALAAAMLTINSVSLNGKPLKFDYENGAENDNLKISLDRLYQANEEVTVKIDYRTNRVNKIDPNSLSGGGGNTGKGLYFSQPTANDPLKPREIRSIGEPGSNRYWFPCFDSPNDLLTTEFTATADKNLTVISNGTLLEIKDNPDGTRTFQYKTDTPHPNHLISFALGEFINVRKNYEGLELNNFGYARERDWVDASTERLPDMVRFFSEKTGVKYPFSSYSQVFVQDIGAFTSSLNVSTITENMVDDFSTHADYFYLWDLTEAEALAGQWFGGYLTAADWRDAWLNKGFSHYFNCLYNEHKNGRDEWLLWVHSFDQSAYFFDWNAGYRRPIVTRNYSDAATMTSDNYSTLRGSLVLNILRKHLGEENWWKAIRHYVKTNAHRSVTTEDFREAVEAATGEKLDWFFDEWLYKMGHPVFEVSENFADGKLTIKVKQTQKIDTSNEYPQTEFFQGKIDIEIDGRIERIQLKPIAENNFTFSLPNSPRFVNFDYENTWIRELRERKTFDEWLAQFENSKDAIAKQTALAELVKIGKNENTTPADKTKIIDALRKKALSGEYWRLRNSAMIQIAGLRPNDEATISMLLTVIKNDKSWLRATAIALLGNTKNARYADLYISALNDESFRVVNSAAVALGKTGGAKAFDALAKLVDRPSMKSQSLLSALNGLKELGDPRGFDIAFKALSDLMLPRWRLPSIPPSWDYRGAAVDLIVSSGKGKTAFPLIFERFKKSMAEDDIEGIFNNILLLTMLADPRGQEAFKMLKAKFKDDANLLATVDQYETQFKKAIGN